MNRVLLIASQPFFEWRGSPIRVATNARALVESGMAVDLLTLPVGQPLAIEGVRMLKAPNLLRVKRVPIGPSVAKLCFDIIMFVQVSPSKTTPPLLSSSKNPTDVYLPSLSRIRFAKNPKS